MDDLFDIYFPTIIYSNLLPIIVLVIFIFLISYNPVFSKKQARLFLLAALIDFIMIIVISLDFIFSAFSTEEFAILRTVTTFLNFTISPLIPLLLYRISKPENHIKWIYIPFVINVILCLISIPTGIIFDIDQLNGYDRGTLFFMPFLTTIYFMVILFLNSRYRYLRSQYSERIFLLIIIALLSGSMILEIVFRYRFFVWTTSAISLPLYYLLLNINHAILDPLTGAFNRLMYTKNLNTIENKKVCVIALLDINDFKNVNDQFGHDVGDRFLIQFTNIISHHIANDAMLYRIGGDEFIIIAKKTNNVQKIKTQLDTALKEANQHQIDFSYGIDVYKPELHLGDFLNTIDQLMYENKKQDKEDRKKTNTTIPNITSSVE